MSSEDIYQPESDRTPYTYLVGWSALNKWYYGCRYGKNCHPSDLWVSYFTSSKYVKEFTQLNGPPDTIVVRKTFLSRVAAKNHEDKVLRRLKVASTDCWLNKKSDSFKGLDTSSIQYRYGKDNPIHRIIGDPEKLNAFKQKVSAGTKQGLAASKKFAELKIINGERFRKICKNKSQAHLKKIIQSRHESGKQPLALRPCAILFCGVWFCFTNKKEARAFCQKHGVPMWSLFKTGSSPCGTYKMVHTTAPVYTTVKNSVTTSFRLEAFKTLCRDQILA